MRDYSDQEIAEALLSGDPKKGKAIERYFDACLNDIGKMVRSIGGSREDVHDISANGMLVLMEKLKRGEEIRSNLRGLLYRICQNLGRALMRKRGREVPLEDNVPEEAYQGPYWDVNLKDALDRAMAKLKERCSKALNLWSNAVDYEEIADRMGFETKESAWNLVSKCRKRLREAVERDKGLFNDLMGYL